MKSIFLTFTLTVFCLFNVFSQTVDLDDYEIYIGPTLIGKSDFLMNSKNVSAERLQKLEFKPITDGFKTAYFLNGNLYSKGEIKNHKENGAWIFWHANGKKAREGEFIDGKPNGMHQYWYESGQLKSNGNWKNGLYEGKWEMYDENGTVKTIQYYKDGKRIEQ